MPSARGRYFRRKDSPRMDLSVQEMKNLLDGSAQIAAELKVLRTFEEARFNRVQSQLQAQLIGHAGAKPPNGYNYKMKTNNFGRNNGYKPYSRY